MEGVANVKVQEPKVEEAQIVSINEQIQALKNHLSIIIALENNEGERLNKQQYNDVKKALKGAIQSVKSICEIGKILNEFDYLKRANQNRTEKIKEFSEKIKEAIKIINALIQSARNIKAKTEEAELEFQRGKIIAVYDSVNSYYFKLIPH